MLAVTAQNSEDAKLRLFLGNPHRTKVEDLGS